MTAPDAQPPAVPEIWWSPSWGVLTKAVTGSGTPFYHHHRAGEALFDPPADAVRLVPKSEVDVFRTVAADLGATVQGVVDALGIRQDAQRDTVLAELGRRLSPASAALDGTPDDAEMRELLREAGGVLRAVGKAALVVKPTLNQPYPDAPETTPWDRFMEAPARRAYNLGSRIRALFASTPTAEDPS